MLKRVYVWGCVRENIIMSHIIKARNSVQIPEQFKWLRGHPFWDKPTCCSGHGYPGMLLTLSGPSEWHGENLFHLLRPGSSCLCVLEVWWRMVYLRQQVYPYCLGSWVPCLCHIHWLTKESRQPPDIQTLCEGTSVLCCTCPPALWTPAFPPQLNCKKVAQ